MRNLNTLTAFLMTGIALSACTSPADVASQAGAGGKTNSEQGGATSSSIGGASVGGAAVGGASVGGAAVGGASVGGAAVGGASGGGAAAGGASGGGAAVGGASGGLAGTSAVAPIEELRSDVTPITVPDITDAEYAAFVGDSNGFGLELQQRYVAAQSMAAQNGVFSPVSAQLALAMTYGAAQTDTAAGMKTTLRDNLGGTKYHAACNRLIRELASRNYSHTDTFGNLRRIELAPANSLWTDKRLPIQTGYLDLLGQQYQSGMRRVDFVTQFEPSRLAINAWVEDNTHNRIKDLLQSGDVSSATRFVLVNALYFYGNWASVFPKTATQPGTFHTVASGDVTAQMMKQSSSRQYKVAGSATVVQLPYVTNGLWMTVVLPETGQFEATRAQISGAWLASMTEGLSSQYVALTFPRFKITTAQMKLEDSLKAMGMASAFTEAADFTGMTTERPLFISHVIQKAFIGVDEDGTEAAAATAVTGETTGLPPTPVPVVVDRPFLFFIQDKSGLVLFSGQVVDPTL